MLCATHVNIYLSKNRETINPPAANNSKAILNCTDISVNCINFARPGAGSSSIYIEKARATTIVTTNGTGLALVHYTMRMSGSFD